MRRKEAKMERRKAEEGGWEEGQEGGERKGGGEGTEGGWIINNELSQTISFRHWPADLLHDVMMVPKSAVDSLPKVSRENIPENNTLNHIEMPGITSTQITLLFLICLTHQYRISPIQRKKKKKYIYRER